MVKISFCSEYKEENKSHKNQKTFIKTIDLKT